MVGHDREDGAMSNSDDHLSHRARDVVKDDFESNEEVIINEEVQPNNMEDNFEQYSEVGGAERLSVEDSFKQYENLDKFIEIDRRQ